MTAAPAPPAAMRLGLIQLASRQVVPNLLMALPLLRAGCLQRHVVLHTDDPAESWRPASQLVNVLAGLNGADRVDWVVQGVEPDAGHVYATACAAMDELGESLRWILHVTGGTKTMAWGLMQLARHPRVAVVLYRDLGAACWRQLRLTADGAPEDLPLAPRDATTQELARILAREDCGLDSLSLPQLLLSQLALTDTLVHVDTTHAPRPPRVRGRDAVADVDVAGWLRSALHRQRGFALAAPRRAALPPRTEEGTAFECWVAHLLVALGARQAQWNVCVDDATGGPLIEFDAVACRGDRLLAMDLKLVAHDSGAKSAELRVAHQTAQWVGGRSAQTAVIRPNWRSSAPVRSVARQLGVHLVTRENLAQLPHLVQAWLGVTPCAQQKALAQTLSELLNQAAQGAAANASVMRHGCLQAA